MEEIYRYCRDFGFAKSDIEKCIVQTVNRLGVNQKKIEEKVLKHIQSIVGRCIAQAASHNMKLKDYQQLAVEYMLVNRGMIAAFDVGTGKTLTAVTVANCILNLASYLGKDIRVIVITPTSLQKNFKKEMNVYGSNPDDKRYTFYTTTKFGIDYKAGLIDCSKTLFIIDEAHNLRTDYRYLWSGPPWKVPPKPGTRAEMAVMCAAKAWKVLLLTATPIYNRTHDVVNLVSMARGVFPPIETNPDLIPKEDFEKYVGNIFLFQKADETEYPEREDILVNIVMPPKYLRAYEEVERGILDQISEKKDEEKAANAFMVQFRKAANSLGECIKCDFAMDIIRKGEKTIFFSSFLSFGVNIIKKLLQKEGIGYYLIDGSTSMKKRGEIVENFNADDGHNVLIITKAGGEGLDLRGVRHVILFEKNWNVANDEQVIGRAVRYRSHKHLPKDQQNVTAWHIVSVKPRGVNYHKTQKEVIHSALFDDFITIGAERYPRQTSDLQPGENLIKSYGVDVYMLLQGLHKDRQNYLLQRALEKVQITSESINNPPEKYLLPKITGDLLREE